MAISGNDWTSVETKYPKFHEDVLIYVPGREGEEGECQGEYFATYLEALTYTKDGITPSWAYPCKNAAPSHWMYLEKPTMEKKP